MCLRLAESYEATELVDAIKWLDSRLLIFLRKLRVLDLRVTEPSGNRWSTQLRRGEPTPLSGGLEHRYDSLDTFRDGAPQRYVVAGYRVQTPNPSHRRRGATEPELLLAFAVSNDGRTLLLSPQFVHAFLPVRDYGFKVPNDFQLDVS